MLYLSCLSCVRLLPLLTILRDDLQRITLQTVPFPVSSAGKSAVNSASCSCCARLILLSCSMISRTGQSQEKRTALSVPCVLLLTLAESVSVFSPCVRQTGDSPSVCSALWDLLSVCPAPADGSGQQTLLSFFGSLFPVLVSDLQSDSPALLPVIRTGSLRTRCPSSCSPSL